MGSHPAIIYIGGSYPQCDGLIEASKVGLQVILTDKNAEPPARRYAHEFYQIDATDSHALQELALKIKLKYNLVAVYGVADYAYQAIADIHRCVLLDTKKSVLYQTLINKAKTRSVLKQSKQLYLPRGFHCDSLEQLGLSEIQQYFGTAIKQVIIKPQCAYNSLVVNTVSIDNINQYKQRVRRTNYYNSGFLVEQVLAGNHYNIDLMVVNNHLEVCSVVTREFVDKKFHQALCGKQLLSIDKTLLLQFKQLAQTVVQVMALTTGVYTIDVIYTDKPYILEISPHFHALKLHKLGNCHFGMRAWLTALLSNNNGFKPTSTHSSLGRYACAYYYLYSQKQGTLIDIDLTCLKALSYDYILFINKGHKIKNSESAKQLLGIVWLREKHDEQLLRVIDLLASKEIFKVEHRTDALS